MPENNKPIYKLKANDVDPATSPPIDQLILWSCSVRANRLVELSDWVKGGSGMGVYDGPKPSYRLRFDWREVESVDEQLEAVNTTLERCFGCRDIENWTLWVSGSQLALLCRDFRTEYLKLQEAKCSQLAILDLWVDSILVKLKDIESSAEADSAELDCSPSPSQPDQPKAATDLLAIPASVSMRARRGSSPVRFMGVPVPNTIATEHIGKRPKFHADSEEPSLPDSAVDTERTTVSKKVHSRLNITKVSTSGNATRLAVVNSADKRKRIQEQDSSSSSSEADESLDATFQIEEHAAAHEDKSSDFEEEEKGSDEEVVFVNETKVRKDKINAAKAAAAALLTAKRVTPKPARKRSKATPNSAATITPSNRQRPAKEKSVFLSSAACTPTPNHSSLAITPSTCGSSSTVAEGDGGEDAEEGDEDIEVVDRRKRKRSKVWDHFTLVSKYGINQAVYKCHACTQDDISARVNSTSNLIAHSRKCAGSHALITGTTRETDQATLDGRNIIIPPFTKNRFHDKVVEWIAVAGLPFTTVESATLRELCKFLHPDAVLPSADTISRKLEIAYETTEAEVDMFLKSVSAVIHYAHDAWTDPAHRNCFFGVYASYVDDQFVYHEVLLRLMHLTGRHTGARLGEGLFDLFRQIGIAKRVGPGTVDNASNNLTTAERLQERMCGDLFLDMPASDLMRCLCHVANLAANDYLNAEVKLESADYNYNKKNIPDIRVIGQDEPHSRIEADDEDDESSEEGAERGSSSVGLDSFAQTDAEVENLRILGVAHRPCSLSGSLRARLARMDTFETIRKDRNPSVSANALPLKDVPTRWNSKEAAIRRVLKLRATIKTFCIRYRSESCPQLDDNTFRILELIQPALAVFAHLTATYSEANANIHHAISDLHDAITELRAMHDHVSLTPARKDSYLQAVGKLEKYLRLLLMNNWACAALALDPINRADGLKSLLETYEAALDDSSLINRYEEVVKWIRERLALQKENEPAPPTCLTPTPATNTNSRRKNAFASRAPTQPAVEGVDNLDAWDIFNDDSRRFEAETDEEALDYWRRHARKTLIAPLAQVVKDVFGMAASTTSVERLFSQSGFVFGKRRGSLSPRMLVKQTSLKLWRLQGFGGVKRDVKRDST